MSRRLCLPFALLLFALLPAASPSAEVPSAAEVQDLLRREPITAESWPTWRGRLRDWIGDHGGRAEAAYAAAHQFLRGQVRPGGDLPPPLKDDALAWYFLSSAYLQSKDPKAEALEAETAARKSLALDPNFARAHRNLARALCLREGPPTLGVPGRMRQEAERELEKAHDLDPSLSMAEMKGVVAMGDKRYGEAEGLFAAARREAPDDRTLAWQQAKAILLNEGRPGGHVGAVKALLDSYPDDGVLVTLHGLALAEDGDARAGARELEHARKLGFEPTQVLPESVVQQIEEEGAPSLLERVGWGAVVFVAFYAAVMLFMTVAGWLLARFTRGTRALQLLGGADPSGLVAQGQVARTGHESWLASFYALLLVLGLLLFYAAIPFLVVGILGMTAGLLYLIFLMPRVPIKLVLIVVVVGLGGAWALFKSLFARPGGGAFGLPKTAADCPRLYEALGEVARRVDTQPVDAVYLAPGSSIGVHQEGRGPFGIFGVKRRVLTLGLSTMGALTVGELKAILAHEYAHFSHSDTFYNRFIYQVALSLGEAMQGMGRTGGKLTYVNPFFWFLYLYYRAYNLLSSGFSRSREFLADRMAACLYGSDVFASALKKVCTEGTLFEMTVYENVSRLLAEQKAFTNVYEAFRSYRDGQLSAEERDKLYQDLLTEKESLFASHPTFRERIEAVEPLPKAGRPDDTPAVGLFEDVAALEKELTEFITSYVAYMRGMHAQAAQEG